MHTPPPATLRPHVRFAILGLGVTQIMGWGTTYYMLSLLGGPIAQELGLTRAAILAGVSMTLAGTAMLGPTVGRWQDRHGSRVVMSVGSLILAAGLLALSFATGPLSYYAAWGLIALGTPMALYFAAFTAMTQLAGRDARRAIIYLTFLGGLASTISWPVTEALLHHLDWRAIARIFAAANLLVCLPIHLGVLGASRPQNHANAAEAVEQGVPNDGLGAAFVLLAAMLAFNSFIFNSWSLLVFPLLDGTGFARSIAVPVASAVGICQVLGRMGEMVLGGRFSSMTMALAAVFLLPLAFIVLLLSHGDLAIGLVFAAVFGVSNGLMTIARAALTLSIFGSRGYGERLGKVTYASGFAGGLAPILGGLGLDLLGAQAMLGILLVVAFGALGLMLALKTHCARHALK